MDIFKKGKFELLAFTETKLKWMGEVSWSVVNVIFVGVQKMETAREGVAILLSNEWYSAVVTSGCVSSRILWIKLKFVWWWGTAPMKEMMKKEIDSGTIWT